MIEQGILDNREVSPEEKRRQEQGEKYIEARGEIDEINAEIHSAEQEIEKLEKGDELAREVAKIKRSEMAELEKRKDPYFGILAGADKDITPEYLYSLERYSILRNKHIGEINKKAWEKFRQESIAERDRLSQ